MKRQVSIVGTINRDRIILPDGAVHEDLGGILYNVLSLAPFAGDEVAIRPVARVGREERERIGALLQAHPSVDPSHLLWAEEGTNETVLRYVTPDQRKETLVERIAPLTWREIARAAEADLLLANLIWGKELTPALLSRLSASCRGPAVLDIQSLTLTFHEGPGRAQKTVPDWPDWVRSVHTLKGNEEEVRWFLGERGEPLPGRLAEGAARVLDQGARVLLVTRGTDGFTFFTREEGVLREASFPAASGLAGETRDTTGCGDAFSSGYLLGLLRDESPLEAALLGNALAGLVSRSSGLVALGNLAHPVEVRDAAYGAERSRIRAGWKGDPA
jgi:sugar/nucleoside kinase (ribokinase family)